MRVARLSLVILALVSSVRCHDADQDADSGFNQPYINSVSRTYDFDVSLLRETTFYDFDQNDIPRLGTTFDILVPAHDMAHFAGIRCFTGKSLTVMVPCTRVVDDANVEGDGVFRFKTNEMTEGRFSTHVEFWDIISPEPLIQISPEKETMKGIVALGIYTSAVAGHASLSIKSSEAFTVRTLGAQDGKYTRTSSGTILMDPIIDLPARTSPSRANITVDFTVRTPTLTGTLVRDVWLSPYVNRRRTRNVYNITTLGAHTRTEDSRLFTARASRSLTQMRFVFPPRSDGIWTRDRIGNIYTSQVQNVNEGTYYDIEPRFQVSGGHSVEMEVGFHSPEECYRLREDDHSLRLLCPVNTTENSSPPQRAKGEVTRIWLPEGARDIVIHSQDENIVWSSEMHRTYLDIVGRPVIVATSGPKTHPYPNTPAGIEFTLPLNRRVYRIAIPTAVSFIAIVILQIVQCFPRRSRQM